MTCWNLTLAINSNEDLNIECFLIVCLINTLQEDNREKNSLIKKKSNSSQSTLFILGTWDKYAPVKFEPILLVH